MCLSENRSNSLDKITFFSRMERQILAGRKVATIRDKSESLYSIGQVVEAYTYEDNRKICNLEILGNEPVAFEQLNQMHAKAENLPFVFILKWILRKIYPNENGLYFITFKVLR
ncbi:ASCH domain-containing protein [Vibrio sp. 10N.261.55.A7]|nr:ASCH domain-containing protein [Vibrio sp. 10N.261.55.A7]